MDELPDLPFEKVLGYLSLEDLLQSRGVSKRWHQKITSFKVNSMLLSEWPRDYLRNKHQLAAGAFAQNYISSSRFESFFGQFGQSMLSQLVHLRLCDLNLKVKSPAIVTILNSFVHLQSLHLIRLEKLASRFRLCLPHLRSIRLESLKWLETLTLDAPVLTEITAWDLQNGWLQLVHPETVRRVLLDNYGLLEVEKLENLERLFCTEIYLFGSSFLVNLKKLKEVHFNSHYSTLETLHEQRQSHGRFDLQTFYRGICLDTPADYDRFPDYPVLDEPVMACVVENYARVADCLPLYCSIYYSRFERHVPLVPADFWSRLTNVKSLEVDRQIENVQQFFDFLRCFDQVQSLGFNRPQPQHLFDQLPVHLPQLESLELNYQNPDLDLAFLFKLTHLIDLSLDEVDAELVKRILQELKFVRLLRFYQENETEACIRVGRSKEFSLQSGEPAKEILTDFDGLIRILSFRKWMNKGD